MKKLMRSFMSETTCHGFSHIYRSKSLFMKGFWTISLLVLMLTFWFSVLTLFAEFLERKIISQTTTERADMTGLQIPSLIICNRNFFSMKKLQSGAGPERETQGLNPCQASHSPSDFGLDSNASSYLMLMAGNPILAKTNLSEEDQAVLRQADLAVRNVLWQRNLTLSQLINALSYTCEELIASCMHNFNYLKGSECCKYYVHTETQLGLCHMYVSRPESRQVLNGEYMGVSLYLSVPEDDVPDLSRHILDMTKVTKFGLQMTVTSNLTYPNLAVVSQGTTVTPGAHTSIALQLTEINEEKVKTPIDVWEPPCIPAHSLDFRQDVGAFLDNNINCFDGIILRCFHEMCGCALYGMRLEDTPMCTLNETRDCYRLLFLELSKFMNTNAFDNLPAGDEDEVVLEKARQCIVYVHSECQNRRVCQHSEYDYTVTTSPIHPKIMDVIVQDLNIENASKVASVTVFFSTMDYTLIKLSRMSQEEVISDLGGYMGLCLGSSIITWIEIVIYKVTLIFTFFKAVTKVFLCKLQHSELESSFLKARNLQQNAQP
ncbi:Na+ channel domain containing protein [Penaeus vannamei]|uniref:Na+ channel domain containing protein n=1 Tax=Penaeus vannamei TaxID=6689 RepID=A0A423U1C8_PENVA|nr:Na+ channel domain containing protein [Penaeus vannamei]